MGRGTTTCEGTPSNGSTSRVRGRGSSSNTRSYTRNWETDPMSFVRDGIENVRVFVLPDGVMADGRVAAVSRCALVAWRSSCTERLHQVYVNGRFAGVTLDSDQRQLVIHAPSSFQSAVRVEVVAVEPEDAHMDFAREIEQPA